MKYTIVLVMAFLFCMLTILNSCSKDKGTVPFQLNNKTLFELVQQTAGTGYYQNGNTLSPAGNSPHGNFKLSMNSIANSILDTNGELPVGNVFPDSSLIIKEIVSGSTLTLYAVMYKYKGSWTWAEYNPNGEVVYSIGLKGAACISCHSESPHRDLIRTFDLH